MLVRDRMSKGVVTIPSSTTILEAEKIMKEKGIRRLPVVDHDRLAGIVTYNDLLEAEPSKATTLSRFELTYLFSKMTVAEIMEKKVITIKPDTPIEEAALIMKRNKVGGLPVVEETRVMGIITESDVFEVLVETLGVELGGTRITIELPEKPGELHQVTGIVSKYMINILSLATFYIDEKPDLRYVVIRIATRNYEPIIKELEAVGITVKHVWVTPVDEGA
ncbi:MAG: CBS and ACT domain-containing protein [Atribacterota bacterium]|nr:CBS and ACT domain-containing protein [Candidatus Atribacteria bacterium]